MTDFPSLTSTLSAEQRLLLDNSAEENAPGEGNPIFELGDGWAAHLARFTDEMRMPLSDEVWNADDWVAALYMRDGLHRAVAFVPTACQDAVSEWLMTIGTRFRDLTEDDDANLIARVIGADPTQGWWWRRVPLGGPVREDLDRYRHQ